MKHNKFVRMLTLIVLLVFSCNALTACNIEDYFVFGGTTVAPDATVNPNIETFEGTKNAIFFAL